MPRVALCGWSLAPGMAPMGYEPRSAPRHDDMYASDCAQVELGVHGTEETHGQLIPNWAHR